VADAHRRGPGVVLHAMDRQPRPRDGHDALDDAHRQPFLFQLRPLLDVQLQVGAQRARHARLGSQVTDALQLVDQAPAVLVAGVVGVLQRDLAGHHAAGDHGGLKAGALLVGEDRQRHRVARADTLVVQRADRLQRAEHAELAVVLAAGGDGVDVRAHHHRRAAGLAGPLAEDVAHLVHADPQASLAHPGGHEIAAALVLVAEGQAGEAAALGRAHLSELLDRRLQACAVDLHVASQRGL